MRNTKTWKRMDRYIHRLVAKYFIENPNNYKVVNHKDCNRANNNADNLEWCTTQYNVRYAIENGDLGFTLITVNSFLNLNTEVKINK